LNVVGKNLLTRAVQAQWLRTAMGNRF